MTNAYEETKRLAKFDTAIEILAAKIGISVNRIVAEESTPAEVQDQKLIERLHRELEILNAERDRMYKGDKEIQDKIYNNYAPEVMEYFKGKKNNAR